MLTGKSVMHVHQDLGKAFSKIELLGYYNNLTEKVTSLPDLLYTDQLPLYTTPSGKKVTFPVDIFQYGLGAYDLYLLTGKEVYKKKFLQCCQWAIDHQEATGAWNTFFFKYPQHPYGAMSQGEAVSLLTRAFKETGNNTYLNAAKKAVDYMLLPKSEGGCTEYTKEGNTLLCEYTHLPLVMNGWIFAWFGLYDYVLITKNYGFYKEILDQSEKSLAAYLPKFSCSYWSKYDTNGKMASPFYHRLHIAQMQAMQQLTGRDIYAQFAARWNANLHNPFFKTLAFMHKAWQKIIEKEAWA